MELTMFPDFQGLVPINMLPRRRDVDGVRMRLISTFESREMDGGTIKTVGVLASAVAAII